MVANAQDSRSKLAEAEQKESNAAAADADVNAEVEAMERISRREVLIFAPLTVLVLWFGVYPASLLDVMTSSILAVLDNAASGGAMVIAGR